MLEKCHPFTDQEPFPVLIREMVEQYDTSESYELDAGAIFRTIDDRYLGVVVSGCS
jgi:hypothetical protein